MALYHLFFQHHGEFIGPVPSECTDDLEALEVARGMSANYGVQVWLSDRFVARVKKGDTPLTIHDLQSG